MKNGISENPFVFPDGSMGWYEIRVEPGPEGAIIFSLNVTERKRSEAEGVLEFRSFARQLRRHR